MNAHAPLVADPVAVRAHLDRLHAVAGAAFEGIHQPGMMQLVSIHPASESTLTFQFSIGEVDFMVDEALRQANTGNNVYVEGRTVRKGVKKRGGSGNLHSGVEWNFCLMAARMAADQERR